ncbi:hypothetical protein HanRHA438_Chr01g0033211 [Helianthus annuus]|uniref:Calmodulin-binding family protein n=1 Tax=Helianthus annuus TaxID=4232 RepID=A0A251VFQ6_HELAN|nr:IQ domain-containing protein IQM2 [Helianthus annuus]KAF5822921.1 hypothetical protein HanXRQr2_Chr01g0032541 [Helianthus annuus]KAJ0612346.1 putative IQ domain-containing protein IQM [Helianthus annuus]KAJ0627689.1 putative IQ domain-containing protein IQM [Helianthus annuus]KAJ0783988.1 putative IQ domain-containing protein IQM [Helianthus annuus]KAJ0948935.1 hypothetical protein HanRHA438_Chr01g0033211 [Helianthus annuus]
MGLSISCPFAACTDLETSLSFNGFQEGDEAKTLIKSEEEEDRPELSPKHEAATKLQKVYKSFRTRRKLADCAVLIEQIWLRVLDSAELQRSSVSFFDIDKHESAISRWARARTRAAKVGKGLSKNCKAQKLALQHWLEAIDPRHRYGHNLHFYYLKWLHSPSKEPFFYWLDIGEGKEVNLVDKCSRSKLQQQCIKYLGPMERKHYEVAIENGKLFYKQSGELIDTTGQTKGAKWIFVLSTTKTLYVGIKKKGYFQHSSFLSGGAALAAGRIIAEKGVLKAVWPHSGHYRPTEENFRDFISFLHENDVDTSNVKVDSNDDDDKEYYGKQTSITRESIPSSEEDNRSEKPVEEIRKPKLSVLEIPKNNDLFVSFKTENQTTETVLDCYSDEEHESEIEDKVSKESIFQRIDSHKETQSFKLGRQVSCKWSTGAGPRIGCLRDYPSELQSHALEEAKLSPTSLESFNRRNNCTYRTQPSPLSARSMNFPLSVRSMNLVV